MGKSSTFTTHKEILVNLDCFSKYLKYLRNIEKWSKFTKSLLFFNPLHSSLSQNFHLWRLLIVTFKKNWMCYLKLKIDPCRCKFAHLEYQFLFFWPWLRATYPLYVPPPAKKTKEAGGSRPTKAKEPSKKKANAKAKKVKEMTCVKTCQPGPRSGCTIQQHYYGHIMGHNW